jgi:uncharacterized protein YjiS (DUF1127 family)
MAHVIHLDHDLPAVPGGLFARLSRAVQNLREYLATREELNALSDRELEDLGISRLEIAEIAREAAYGN